MPGIFVDGRPIHYAEAGNGPPLVLVHGTLLDQRYWAPQMEAFGARYHVYALSMLGCWPTTWDGHDFTIARHTADVAGFIRSIGGRARLLGHSRGGHIAFRVASEHPDLVEELVLSEPGGDCDESLGGKPAATTQAAGFATVAEDIAAGRIDEGLRQFADRVYGAGTWDSWPEDSRQHHRENARSMLGQAQENRKPYSLAAAQAIEARTLLLHGGNTQPSFIANVAALSCPIRNARTLAIPGTTHDLSNEAPAAFNAAVLDFLTPRSEASHDAVSLPQDWYREVVADGVCAGKPGIYRWQIEGAGVYIGRYTKISRPRYEYQRNVERILNGWDYRHRYRKFRRVHRALAHAHSNRRRIVLTILANAETHDLNRVEKQHIRSERANLNGLGAAFDVSYTLAPKERS